MKTHHPLHLQKMTKSKEPLFWDLFLAQRDLLGLIEWALHFRLLRFSRGAPEPFHASLVSTETLYVPLFGRSTQTV